MDDVPVDEPITVRATRYPGWYAVERAVHDGRAWIEHVEPLGQRYMTSAKICDADVGGSADELRELAAAIETRGSFAGRRCAVAVADERAWLWSPRDGGRRAVVPLARAQGLAEKVRERLG